MNTVNLLTIIKLIIKIMGVFKLKENLIKDFFKYNKCTYNT